MEAIRLFRVPSGFQVSCTIESAMGWRLVIDRKFDGEPWSIDDRTVYEALSLDELADVLLQELYTVRP